MNLRFSRQVQAASLEHQWSIGSQFLSGLTAHAWGTLLRSNSLSPAYWHRALFLTLSSAFNSINARRERQFDADVRATELKAAPIFILGHWRSGTTHLHNLLARDTANFAFCNTYQVLNPLSFLTTESRIAPRLGWMVPGKRLMDNVELSFAVPQEDEFALCLMTLASVYLGNAFPQRERYYDRYMTFEGVSHDEIEAWKQALLWFCKKLTFKYQRPLVLKSPPHTSRIRVLLELFPAARFVHIRRHPHDVFRSTRHYRNTAFWYHYLQRPDRSAIDTLIIDRYRALYDAYFAQKELIPPGHLHELAFEELERDPVGQLASLYKALGLPGYACFEPALRGHLALQDYRKNQFEPLEAGLRERLAHAWRREFEEWAYQP